MDAQSWAALKACEEWFENVTDTVYGDSTHHPTIGIGHNLVLDNIGAAANAQYQWGVLDSVGIAYDMTTGAVNGGAPLTSTQIDALYNHDVHEAYRQAKALIPQLDLFGDSVQMAVIDIAFQSGAGALAKTGIAAALNHGNVGLAAELVLESGYYRRNPNRGPVAYGWMYRDANLTPSMAESMTAAAKGARSGKVGLKFAPSYRHAPDLVNQFLLHPDIRPFAMIYGWYADDPPGWPGSGDLLVPPTVTRGTAAQGGIGTSAPIGPPAQVSDGGNAAQHAPGSNTPPASGSTPAPSTGPPAGSAPPDSSRGIDFDNASTPGSIDALPGAPPSAPPGNPADAGAGRGAESTTSGSDQQPTQPSHGALTGYDDVPGFAPLDPISGSYAPAVDMGRPPPSPVDPDQQTQDEQAGRAEADSQPGAYAGPDAAAPPAAPADATSTADGSTQSGQGSGSGPAQGETETSTGQPATTGPGGTTSSGTTAGEGEPGTEGSEEVDDEEQGDEEGGWD